MGIYQLPQLSFGDALKAACNKIVQFNGRSRRSEFWWTMLVVVIINVLTDGKISGLLQLLMIPITFRRLHDTGHSGWWYGAGIISEVAIVIMAAVDFGLATFMEEFSPAMFSSMIGKYILIAIGFLAYHIVVLVFLCQDSQPFTNQYGESPKYPDDPESDIFSEPIDYNIGL